MIHSCWSGWHAVVRFALALVWVLPVLARVTAHVEYEGKNVPDAELCFYVATPADPLGALESAEIRCYPAVSMLEIPGQTYGVFARRTPDLIGAHHAHVFGSNDPRPGVTRVGLTVNAAARLNLKTLTMRPDEHVSLLIAETTTNRPAVMPLDRSGASHLVPANTPLIPLLVREGRIVRVGMLQTLLPGEESPVVFGEDSSRAVLLRFRARDPFPKEEVSLGCDIPYSADFVKQLIRADPPVVKISDSRGNQYESRVLAVNSANLFESLYVFRDVPPGSAKIVISGRHWQSAVADLQITDGIVTPDPVLVMPGAALRLALDATPDVMKTSVECDSAVEREGDSPRVVLYDCGAASDDVTARRESLDQCTVEAIRGITDPRAALKLEFPGLSPGTYIVASELGERVMNVEPVNLEASTTTDLEMAFVDLFVAGRISRDGEPVAASIRFRTGSAVTDPDSGEYVAILGSPPGKGVIHVVACDESFVYMHKPEHDVPYGPGYDLELPSNKLWIDVTDATTGTSLPDASVDVSMVEETAPDSALGIVPAFADGDRFRVGSLERGIHLVACASHQGYERTCSEPLKVREKSQELTLRLSPLDKKGIVHDAGYATIYWCRPDGTVSERAVIDGEGEFHYKGDHPYDHLVLVGAGAPLWVTQAPVAPDGTLDLHPPQDPVRTIQIRPGESNPRETTTVLFWINGFPVPIPAFAEHQIARGHQWLIVDRVPLIVPDLYQSHSVAVTEGPDPETQPHLLAPEATVFAGRRPHTVVGSEFVLE